MIALLEHSQGLLHGLALGLSKNIFCHVTRTSHLTVTSLGHPLHNSGLTIGLVDALAHNSGRAHGQGDGRPPFTKDDLSSSWDVGHPLAAHNSGLAHGLAASPLLWMLLGSFPKLYVILIRQHDFIVEMDS